MRAESMRSAAPLASARRQASVESPSLKSIAAVAPCSRMKAPKVKAGSRPAMPAHGAVAHIDFARRQTLESEQRAAEPPGYVQPVSRSGAAASERFSPRRRAGYGHIGRKKIGAGDVSADQRKTVEPMLAGGRSHAPHELPQRAADAPLRKSQGQEKVKRTPAHRRDIAQRAHERLASQHPQRMPASDEVLIFKNLIGCQQQLLAAADRADDRAIVSPGEHDGIAAALAPKRLNRLDESFFAAMLFGFFAQATARLPIDALLTSMLPVCYSLILGSRCYTVNFDRGRANVGRRLIYTRLE